MSFDLGQAHQLQKALLNQSKHGDLSMYKEAQERGLTFSDLLEELDPSPQDAKGDAFQRQMLLFELVHNPSRPITVDSFFVKSGMILLPEFMQREISAGYGMIYEPASLISTVVMEKGPTVTPIYIKTAEAEKSAAIKGDGAAYPRSQLFYREKSVGMVDRGREFDFSYKVIRNQQLTEFRTFLRYIGAQIATDELDEIWTLIIAGDGSSPAATDVFAGTAGTLAYSDIVHLAMSFAAPCQMTHILCNQSAMETILNLTEYKNPEIWLALQKISGMEYLTGLLPMNAKLVICPGATATILVGLDARFALRETVAQPLMIEADAIIEQKIEQAVISKESVYTILLDDASFKSDYTV